MKKILLILAALGLSGFANAAKINSGSYNSKTQKVEMSVSYGGGCSKHTFKLELAGGCRESFPVQCDLKLVHTTDKPDYCKAYITEDLELELPEVLFTDDYYDRASLGILESDIYFQLPEQKPKRTPIEQHSNFGKYVCNEYDSKNDEILDKVVILNQTTKEEELLDEAGDYIGMIADYSLHISEGSKWYSVEYSAKGIVVSEDVMFQFESNDGKAELSMYLDEMNESGITYTNKDGEEVELDLICW